MKNYTITVNGNVYDVVVEEGAAGAIRAAAPVAAPVPVAAAPAPVAAPAPAAAPAPVAQASGSAGSKPVTAKAAGKVFRVEVSVGQEVKAGDTVAIVEAMKMEIPMVTTEGGTVASIEVKAGQMIESGAVLVTLS